MAKMTKEEIKKAKLRYKKNKVKLSKIIRRITNKWRKDQKDN